MAGRRGHDEGSITKRADGSWEAKISLGYRSGKDGKVRRVRKSFYGKTRREVADKLNLALRDHQQGLPVAVERQTVATFLDRWLEEVVRPTVRPRTHHSYAQLVRVHIAPAIGRHQLTTLAPQHVQTMMNDKLAAGLSPRTVQYLRAVLRRALGQALKWGLVARNVATLVDPPRSVRHEIAFLTPAQARTFLDVVRGDRQEALYRVALSLGLRQGEALGLRWQDVDLDDRTLRVRVALQRIGGKLVLTEPKTRQSRRSIPMPGSVVAALREHRDRQTFERATAGDRWQDWGLVFPTPTGTPVDARNAVRHFKAALVRAGLPPMRWHDLRHSCASLQLAQGIAPRVVMETLGHSQIGITMNTYSHVIPEMQRQAADLMDDLLSGTGG